MWCYVLTYSEGWGGDYLIPCWFCMFAHWQRNYQSIILMVGYFNSGRQNNNNKKIPKNTFQKSYKLICILMREISIWPLRKTWLRTVSDWLDWQIKSDECVRWGPACRITNLLESNSWYQGLWGHHTPGRVGPDSHRRRLTGRLISKSRPPTCSSFA